MYNIIHTHFTPHCIFNLKWCFLFHLEFSFSYVILTVHAIASECDTSFYYRDRHSGGQSRTKRRLKWGIGWDMFAN